VGAERIAVLKQSDAGGMCHPSQWGEKTRSVLSSRIRKPSACAASLAPASVSLRLAQGLSLSPPQAFGLRNDDSHLDRYMRERRTSCALLAMDQKRWQQRVYEGLKRDAQRLSLPHP